MLLFNLCSQQISSPVGPKFVVLLSTSPREVSRYFRRYMRKSRITEIENQVMGRMVYITHQHLVLNKFTDIVKSKSASVKHFSLTWKLPTWKLSLSYNTYWAQFPALVWLNCRELISDSDWLRSSCSDLLRKWNFLGKLKKNQLFHSWGCSPDLLW